MGSYLSMQQGRDPLSPNNPRLSEDRQLVQLGQQGAGSGTPITPSQRQQQQQLRINSAEQWQSVLGELTKGSGELDAPGRAKLNDLTLKTESLIAARGNLRDDEFESSMKSVYDTAVDYAWEHHIKPPGSNPGDIVEEEGIRKLTQADGSRVPVAYTPQFMSENTVPIGTTGKVAIPVSPTEPYEIVDAKDRDISGERGEIDKAHKGITANYEELTKLYLPEKEVTDDEGKVIGTLPFTSTERRTLSNQASDAYIKDQLQAKHAATVIADAGAEEVQRYMGGEVQDPYKTEQEIIDKQREIVLTRQARKDAAGELMKEQGITPQPSPSPVPGQETDEEAQAAALLGELGAGSGTKTPEERAESSMQYQEAMAIKRATTDETLDFSQKMLQGATMNSPLKAPNKAAMNELYLKEPEGVVVELGDGRRFIKDDGQFWELAWDRQQVTSDVMLDSEGNEIIDPSTGKAAEGIVQQLDEGKYKEFSPSGIAHAAATGPPVSRGKQPQRIPEEIQRERMAQAVAPDERQIRTAAQQRQTARQPGSAAEAVEPERTAQVASGLDQSKLPQTQPHQPALAVQEAEQERVRQQHDANTQFDPNLVQEYYRKVAKDPNMRRAVSNPVNLREGQSPEEFAPGTAFIEPQSQAIYLKLPNGRYLGPIDDDVIRAASAGRSQSVKELSRQVSVDTIF